MPPPFGPRYFAVVAGNEGSIRDLWEENADHDMPKDNVRFRFFQARDEAQAWVDANISTDAPMEGIVRKEPQVALPITPPRTPLSRKTNQQYPNSSRHWKEYESPDVPVRDATATQELEELHDNFHAPVAPVTLPAEALPPTVQPQPNHNVIQLSAEQQEVLEMVKMRQNVFFTGPAGTGKSVLLREIVKTLRSGNNPTNVAITASTGIAGVNIGGSTIHSFSGILLGKESAEDLAYRISNTKHLRERWVATKTLIIDEISMLDGILFDKLEYVARIVRKSTKPFGGVQLVISGDFCQLPPVPDESHEYKMASTFAFEVKSWAKCIGRPIVLTHVFRQKDKAFVDILSSMRIGELMPEHVQQLTKLSRPIVYEDGIEASQLFPLRSQVQSYNKQRLDALQGDFHNYKSMDSSGYDVRNKPIEKVPALKLLDRLVALSEISLKVGAQVMLIQNVVQGSLVNGSCGKVIDFMTTHEALQKQIRIATLSVHDKNNIDIDGKEPRPKPKPPQKTTPISHDVFSKNELWPLVQFTNGLTLLCAPLEFTVEGFVANLEAKRLQVPLILAWALSIHKSQGQTLERVKVDLKRIFEKGQAYVAISRATTMEHLQITNFHPSKVEAHPRVLEWQRSWMSGHRMSDHNDWEDEFEEMDSMEAISRYHEG